MAQIFVSYSRADQDAAVARKVVAALEEQGWTVWWDQSLLAGQNYHTAIEQEIANAGCVVVLWSETSRERQFVLGEATTADARGALVPAKIDNCKPPVGFAALHTVDLQHWSGRATDARFTSLIKAVAAKLGDDARSGIATVELAVEPSALDVPTAQPTTMAISAFRYSAFIANNVADDRAAELLRRELQAFRLPSSLVGLSTEVGPLPRRLAPMFRLRADLLSTGDFSQGIDQALNESSALVVLCSPNAAKSVWVNREIEAYREKHGDGRIFAVIAPDVPLSTPALECFPPALMDNGNEPLAADARKGRGGMRLAAAKVTAGLLGLPLDSLRMRERQRQQAQSAGVIAIAALIVLNVIQAALLAILVLIPWIKSNP